MLSDPAPDHATVPNALQALRETLRQDPAALGERLVVIGSGPLPIPGALGGLLALDPRGAGVLVAAFASLPTGAAAGLADELDRLGQLTGARLEQAANEVDGRPVKEVHSEVFNGPGERRVALNAAQRAFVVLSEKPGIDAWRDLRAELGPQLHGVRLWKEGTLQPEPLPDQLRRTERSRSFRTWIAVTAAMALGVGIAIGSSIAEEPDSSGSRPLVSAPALVAAQAPGDATHSQWIGQRRVVRTPDGHLIAAYGDSSGLVIVADHANQGRSWGRPQPFTEISPTTFSMAIDTSGRLHVAFLDAQGVGYVNLQESPEGLIASPLVRVNAGAISPVVDIAFDSSRSLAHVIWVEGDPAQQPVWTAVSAPEDADPAVLDTMSLAEPGSGVSVLANIGVGTEGAVIATYRRGDSITGWFARHLDAANPAGFIWSAEELLPVADVLFGAGSLTVDRRGDAHVVLRDDTDHELTYLKREMGSWLPAERAVNADATEHIDFPTISADLTSETVFVFYQDTTSVPQGQIKAVARDPEIGWGAPGLVTSGSSFPTSIGLAGGVSVVLATSGSTGSITASSVGAG